MAVKIKPCQSATGINVTPLIDCIFMLLLFLLVAANFEAEEREMHVVLPQASQAKPLTSKPKELFVSVSRQGEYMVQGKFQSATELDQILRQASANNPGRQSVIIRADERCEWKHVVLVMDLCNKAQIRDYRVTTSPKES